MDGWMDIRRLSLATAVYVGGRPLLLLIFEWWQSTNVRPAKAWMVSMRPSSPIGLHLFLSFLYQTEGWAHSRWLIILFTPTHTHREQRLKFPFILYNIIFNRYIYYLKIHGHNRGCRCWWRWCWNRTIFRDLTAAKGTARRHNHHHPDWR